MHRVDRRSAKANLGEALRRLGWTLLGWTPDQSDAMTDHYSPATWGGVAFLDPAPGSSGLRLVAVVDHRARAGDPPGRRLGGTIPERFESLEGPCSSCSGSGRTLREARYPRMVSLLGTEVSPARVVPAGSPCEGCSGSGRRREMRRLPDEGREGERWPTYGANPPRRLWHVEELSADGLSGEVLASGVGLEACARSDYREPTAAELAADPFRYGPKTTDWGGERETRTKTVPFNPGAEALASKIDAAARRRLAVRARPAPSRADHASVPVPCDPDAPTPGGPVLSENDERDGYELRFPSKPPRPVLEALKAAGWRWYPTLGAWCRRRDPRALELALGLGARRERPGPDVAGPAPEAPSRYVVLEGATRGPVRVFGPFPDEDSAGDFCRGQRDSSLASRRGVCALTPPPALEPSSEGEVARG